MAMPTDAEKREELWGRLQYAAQLMDEGRKAGWVSKATADALDTTTEQMCDDHFTEATKQP